MAIKSFKEDERPSDQWYWDDWFSSHDVQSCSFAAQGLWMNLLGIMFSSKIRGTLAINEIQMDNKAIAKRFGRSITEINKLISELEEARIFSRLENGTIISRRLYRESKKKEQISQIRSEAGKKGMKQRWQNKKGKKITKITASTPSSTSSPTPNIKISSISSLTAQIKEIQNKWNVLAQKYNLPQIAEIKSQSTREKHIKARMKEEGFDFQLLLDMIENSPFLLGRTKHVFFVFFDWIIKPNNYQKIIEGNYLDRQSYQKFSGIIEGIKELGKKTKEEDKNETGRS